MKHHVYVFSGGVIVRFGIKGVFYVETSFLDLHRHKEKIYESRIINIEADTEAQAYEKALAIFMEDEWEAQPAKYINLQRQRFIGISHICDLRHMELYEVWYEYTDGCPKIIKPAR